MSLKYKLLILTFSLVLSFSLGRYSATSKSTPQTQETTNTGEKIHTVTVITEDHGKKVTEVTQDETVNTTSKETTKSTIQSAPKQSNFNVSVLGGVLVQTRPDLVYGVSVSKQVIGPITGGLFGLSNGILGVSIGLNF